MFVPFSMAACDAGSGKQKSRQSVRIGGSSEETELANQVDRHERTPSVSTRRVEPVHVPDLSHIELLFLRLSLRRPATVAIWWRGFFDFAQKLFCCAQLRTKMIFGQHDSTWDFIASFIRNQYRRRGGNLISNGTPALFMENHHDFR